MQEKETEGKSASTFAADMPLEDKFAEWKKEESSAAELFNSCLYVVLPIVKETVGTQLIQLNESGGLDVASGYNMTVHPRTGDKTRKLTPDELIKTLQIEMKTCRVRTKDTIITKDADDENPTDEAAETVDNRLLNLDMKVKVAIEFGRDNVEFKLERGGWFSPAVELAVKEINLELHTRVWWDMARRQLKVGFVEDPVVDWDIELKPMIMHFGLDMPDVIEDGVLTCAIEKVLTRFDINNPYTIDLSPDEPDPKEAVSSEEMPSAIDVASLPVVASLSPALKPVLYDQATGVLARLGAGAEAANAEPAGEKAAMTEFGSLPIVDSLNPTMRLIFFNEDTGELVQLGSP